jgi:hypothetical protein
LNLAGGYKRHAKGDEMRSNVFYLALERLEDRTLLSTCHVTRLGDIGADGVIGEFARGDLRFCINYANARPGKRRRLERYQRLERQTHDVQREVRLRLSAF